MFNWYVIMLKNVILFCLIAVFLVPVIQAYALTGDTELVLENVGIVPMYPKPGDMISITADVYNIGLKNTNSVTSMITIAYFVDGDLLYVDNIDNISPGLSNKIDVTSPPIWESETGYHEITVIVDYHDTLNDQYDSPFDNSVSEKFFIEFVKNTRILLEADPQFFLLGETVSKITISLFDYDSNEFLSNKKITLYLDGDNSTLTTDQQGMVSFSNTVSMSSSNLVNLEAHFDGDEIYSPSSSSMIFYSFPQEISSALVLKIPNSNQYDFENYSFDILIYQDSYEKLIKKVQPDSTMLFDSNIFWIPLPFGHDYFAEIYLDGRIFSVTDKIYLEEYDIIAQTLDVPEMGKIKFVVTDDKNQFVTGAMINNWIYSFSADDGFTDWVDVFPTTVEPYVAEAILSDQRTIKSKPFLVFPGEQKIIDITTGDVLSKSKIPSWIKNNAGWWADDLIDDSSFVQGIQFLIQEELILVPSTTTINSDKSNDKIPSWIKNNAGWWADDLIDDSSFVQGIQFLIQEGLIKPS